MLKPTIKSLSKHLRLNLLALTICLKHKPSFLKNTNVRKIYGMNLRLDRDLGKKIYLKEIEILNTASKLWPIKGKEIK